MINENQQALLELIKASLFGTEPSFPDGADWDAVLKEAKDQTVVALAAPAVPQQEKAKWQIHVAQNTMYFLQLLNEQTNLVQMFMDAGIPMAIIKGCSAAIYYPAPIQRTMGDIDFVVSAEHLDEANQLMVEKGYRFTEETPRHFDYTKNSHVLELHHHYSDPEWDFEATITEGLSHAVPCEMYGKPFCSLPVEVNGLVLLDHVRRHLKKGLGLRQIIDWMMFVHTELKDDTVWKNRFLPHVRELGLEPLAITMTKMCQMWLGLSDEITWCSSADDKTAQLMLEMVFHFGNFGRKENTDLSTTESIMAKASRMGMFSYLQMAGEKNWKAYHRHPGLRPFAWFYQIIRYGKNGLGALFHGEKDSVKISPEVSQMVKKKNQLYKKLQINKNSNNHGK